MNPFLFFLFPHSRVSGFHFVKWSLMIFLDYCFVNHSGLSKMINPSNSYLKCHPICGVILMAWSTHWEDLNNCIITHRSWLNWLMEGGKGGMEIKSFYWSSSWLIVLAITRRWGWKEERFLWIQCLSDPLIVLLHQLTVSSVKLASGQS